jgi:Zn ribbon nucleic-acid-binding protein
MDYTNCPECSAATKATTWECFDGETDGACWCPECGWNDRNSLVRRRQIERRNAAAAGLTVEQWKAQRQEAARIVWMSFDADTAPAPF